MSYADPAGDLTDLDGNPVAQPAYIDVIRLDATVGDGQLRLLLVCSAAAPSGVDGNVQQINYLIQIDTEAPDDFDFWLVADNRSSGEYAFAITDWAENYTFDSENGEFPGSGFVDSGLVGWSLPMTALGNPQRIRVSVWTQESVDFEPHANDFLPDAAQDMRTDPSGWLVVLP